MRNTPRPERGHIGLWLAVSMAALVLITVTGCGTRQPAPEIPPNLDTYQGLADAIAAGEDVLIYDVRSKEETESGMIPTAVNIPHTEIVSALPESHKNRVIVVYCQSGRRSRAAYEALTEEGFLHVYDFGGVGNWQGELE
jgi:rhodanese-related sulfurtransferase